MNILVTGATGAVGPCVVQALCEAGNAVRTFSLDRPLDDAFPPNIEVRIGDVTDPSAVQSAMQGVDAVIHIWRRFCTLSIPRPNCARNMNG